MSSARPHALMELRMRDQASVEHIIFSFDLSGFPLPVYIQRTSMLTQRAFECHGVDQRTGRLTGRTVEISEFRKL